MPRKYGACKFFDKDHSFINNSYCLIVCLLFLHQFQVSIKDIYVSCDGRGIHIDSSKWYCHQIYIFKGLKFDFTEVMEETKPHF
jgi:hypothetical protein